MVQVTLIQCTNSKTDVECKAKRLYEESAYFRKMKAYAQAKGDDWYILSGKHGLVHPLEELEPYDVVGISAEQAKEIAEVLDFNGVDSVEIVAGKQYTEHLVPELESCGIEVVNRFKGMKIGERQGKLDTEVARMENQSLC